MGQVPKQLQKFVFKKGNKLGGRKKGKSLKEFARQFLSMMTNKEKIDFMNSLNPDVVWRMAEGNPAQDLTSGGEKLNPIPIYGGQSISRYKSNAKDIPTEQKD